MKVPVYIHTRSRLGFIDKVIPRWLDQRHVGKIRLVVEPDEFDMTEEHIRSAMPGDLTKRVEVVALDKPNMGMGYARSRVVRHAWRCGYQVIIMSDDDLYPVDDVRPLVEQVDAGLIGCGVCVTFYGLSLGNDFIKESSEAVAVSGAWGFRCFALNIPQVVKNGSAYGLDYGFDPALDVGWEDGEVARMAIAQARQQWHIHTGVMANSIGARYAPGGIEALTSDLEERKRREKECHRRIWARWGGTYISAPEKKFRCNWTRMLRDYGLKRS